MLLKRVKREKVRRDRLGSDCVHEASCCKVWGVWGKCFCDGLGQGRQPRCQKERNICHRLFSDKAPSFPSTLDLLFDKLKGDLPLPRCRVMIEVAAIRAVVTSWRRQEHEAVVWKALCVYQVTGLSATTCVARAVVRLHQHHVDRRCLCHGRSATTPAKTASHHSSTEPAVSTTNVCQQHGTIIVRTCLCVCEHLP